MMMCGTIFICIGLFVTIVKGYPQGAPVQAQSCLNLQPVHMDPATRQQVPNINSQSPFRILMSQQFYRPCVDPRACQQQPIQVAIRGLPQQGTNIRQLTPFRGFIIQARTPSGGQKSWGQFIPFTTGDSKVIQCQNGFTLTHTSNVDKQQVAFNWIPEPNMREQVQFVATVVQNFRTIYPQIYSDIAKPSVFIRTTPTTTTATTATTTTTTTSTTTTTTTTPSTTSIVTSTFQIPTGTKAPAISTTSTTPSANQEGFSSGTKITTSVVAVTLPLLLAML